MLGQGFSQTVNPAQSWMGRAWAALQSNQLETAVDAAKRALSYDATLLQAYWLWALAAGDLFRYDEAAAALNEGANRIKNDDALKVRFLTQRARVLVLMGLNGEAKHTILQALDFVNANPALADAEALHFLGTSLIQSGHEAEALPVLRWSARLNATNAGTWAALGEAADYMGLTDEAESAYETAITAGSDAGAHLSLARLRRWTSERNHIQRLESLTPRHPYDAARRAYALFKEYDDIGDTDRAWDWLQKGAAAALTEPVTPFNPAWSAAEERAQREAWLSAFPVSRFSNITSSASAAPTRIFVLGMPRSGTTLVERILNAHSQVLGLGELQSFPAAVKVSSGVRGHDLLTADVIRAVAETEASSLAQAYNRDLSHMDDGRWTVDKLPRNADYAGLIRLASPDARIVHVHRDPMDTLFGAYKLHFVARWSYDQNDLADHYAHHRALMAHWRACLGHSLIEVSLEALIADPETQIRRLLDLCGLPFEEACLSPHKSQGAVASASSSQVRKPINAEGVGAWRRYEAQLAPLHDRLSEMGLLS